MGNKKLLVQLFSEADVLCLGNGYINVFQLQLPPKVSPPTVVFRLVISPKEDNFDFYFIQRVDFYISPSPFGPRSRLFHMRAITVASRTVSSSTSNISLLFT